MRGRNPWKRRDNAGESGVGFRTKSLAESSNYLDQSSSYVRESSTNDGANDDNSFGGTTEKNQGIELPRWPEDDSHKAGWKEIVVGRRKTFALRSSLHTCCDGSAARDTD